MVVGLTSTRFVAAVVAAALVVPVVAAAQTPSGQAARPAGQAAAATAPDQGVTPPADYVIGPDDVLAVLFWREKDLSAEVVVRPDGMITLPLVNDVQAAGLTPDQLRDRVQEAASKFVELLHEDPETFPKRAAELPARLEPLEAIAAGVAAEDGESSSAIETGADAGRRRAVSESAP